MIIKKTYEIKRGQIRYKKKKEFKSIIHEHLWKIKMFFRGCKVKEICNL